MLENRYKAKEVWERYLQNESKSSIAKAVQIQRSEVISIIKYTTSDMYLNPEESEDIKGKYEDNIEAVKEKARDIIRKKNKTIEKFEKEVEELKETKVSLFGKKLL